MTKIAIFILISFLAVIFDMDFSPVIYGAGLALLLDWLCEL